MANINTLYSALIISVKFRQETIVLLLTNSNDYTYLNYFIKQLQQQIQPDQYNLQFIQQKHKLKHFLTLNYPNDTKSVYFYKVNQFDLHPSYNSSIYSRNNYYKLIKPNHYSNLILTKLITPNHYSNLILSLFLAHPTHFIKQYSYLCTKTKTTIINH